MTGRMLHVAEEPHWCDPPIGRPDGLLLAAVPDGSVWRCDCGRLWVAYGAGCIAAGRLTRWRYRKHAGQEIIEVQTDPEAYT